MRSEYQILFETYYKYTLGRFYTPRERGELLRLFAGSLGLVSTKAELRLLLAEARACEAGLGDSLTSEQTDDSPRGLAGEVREILICTGRWQTPLGKYRDRQDWISKTLAYLPPSNEVLYERALIYFVRGHLNSAVQCLEELCGLDEVLATCILAYIYSELKDYRMAYYHCMMLELIYSKRYGTDMPRSIRTLMQRARAAISYRDAEELYMELEALFDSEGKRVIYRPHAL